MKFGISQITKTTPLIISRVKRAINFFIAGVVTFFPFVSKLTGIPMDDLSQIVGLFALFVNSFGVMFGIEPDVKEPDVEPVQN